MDEPRCLVDDVALLDVGQERHVGIGDGNAVAKRLTPKIGP